VREQGPGGGEGEGPRPEHTDPASDPGGTGLPALGTVLDSLPHPFYVIRASDFTVTLTNAAARSNGVVEGGKCYRMSYDRSKPCDGSQHPCTLTNVVRTGRPTVTRHNRTRRDGSEAPIDVYGYPVFDEHGHVSEVIEYCVDVSDRMRAERRLLDTVQSLTQLHEAARKLSRSTSANDACQLAVEYAAILFQFDACRVSAADTAAEFARDHEAQTMLLRLAASPDQPHTLQRPDGSVAGVLRVAASGVALEAIESTAVPVDTLPMVELLLTHTSAALHRSELERTLRGSRDNLVTLVDQMRVATAMVDGAGNVSFVSREAARLLERAPDALEGKPWEKLFSCWHSSDGLARLRATLDLRREKRSKSLQRWQLRSGVERVIEVDIEDDVRGEQRTIFLFHDVTELHELRHRLEEQVGAERMVGQSQALKDVVERIRAVATIDTTVLITGETGTGKELVARAIHNLSNRREHQFVAVNAAALTDSLLASQLFGHKRGAFTGAVRDQEGVFEAAQHGTLFLDEIGDVSASTQASLLRVLDEHVISRVGEANARPVDIRVIAATNRDLATEARAGHFRQDLFYRLNVARIDVPPLRERREDIPLLVDAFLNELSLRTGRGLHRVEETAMRQLSTYPWPGNIRELHSALEYAAIAAAGDGLALHDFPPEIADHLEGETDIANALRVTGGNRAAAARLLGISRATLYRRLGRKH